MSDGEATIVIKGDQKITIEWRIQNYFSQSKTVLLSPYISFGNEKLFLTIYPHGDKRHNVLDSVSLYLHKSDSPSTVRVVYRMGLKKPGGSVFRSFDGEDILSTEGFGQPTFISTSELSESKYDVAPIGVLTVFCHAVRFKHSEDATECLELRREDQLEEAATQTSSVKTLTANFKDLLITGLLADVKIKVGDREFAAHTCVLAARSPVFSCMFEHEMTEKSSGIVNIPDCDSDTFQNFLTFVYTGELDHVDPSTAVGLYRTADKYDMKELKKGCCQCLANYMKVDTVCDVIHLAVMHQESELLEKATEFFIKHSRTILRTPRWYNFLVDYPSIVNDLFIEMANKLGALLQE